jgi:hypothetical protein
MSMTEVRSAHRLPEWTIEFLRTRCSSLQQVLAHTASDEFVVALDDEADSIHCWGLVLLAADDLPRDAQAALDELHLLHAQIAERTDRGGVGDISQDVEFLVRTVLIDRLQRLTDIAVARLGS